MNNIIPTQFAPLPYIFAPKVKKGDFVPDRPNHQKDEAIEEYIEGDNNAASEENSDDNRQDQMGISEKAKRQSSDEGDRAKGKKD
jgi:hypothetical protein